MITVGIKALNAETSIASALEYALKAVMPFGGRVILGDCGSSDRTVEIAQRFPVQILQLQDFGERCCGAGAQLAFQEVKTEFFYMQDADMTLSAAFLPEAVGYLHTHPEFAAVGGHVIDRVIANEEFRIRAASSQAADHLHPGVVDRLDGGGLYRVAAVRQLGYFADRNLHAFEEFDLAARLAAAGWKLARLDIPAVDHYGHADGSYRLMWRRFTSGYTAGAGEVLRAALGRKHSCFVLLHLRHLRHAAVVMGWWGALALAAIVMPLALVPLILVPLLFLRVRRGTLPSAVYSVISWNITTLGALHGFVRRRDPPDQPLRCVDLSSTEPVDGLAHTRRFRHGRGGHGTEQAAPNNSIGA